MLMVDGSNDASWRKEVPFGYGMLKNAFRGSMNLEYLGAVGNHSLNFNAQERLNGTI